MNYYFVANIPIQFRKILIFSITFVVAFLVSAYVPSKLMANEIQRSVAQQDDPTGTLISLQSYNFPERFVRHTSYQGFIHPIESELDRQDSTFRLVRGLADPNHLSLESANFPNYFLVVEGDAIFLRERVADAQFAQNATFVRQLGLIDPASLSLESYAQRGSYVRHSGFVLFVNAPDGSDLFKEDATFKQTPPNWTPPVEPTVEPTTAPTNTAEPTPEPTSTLAPTAAPIATSTDTGGDTLTLIPEEQYAYRTGNSFRYILYYRSRGDVQSALHYFDECPTTSDSDGYDYGYSGPGGNQRTVLRADLVGTELEPVMHVEQALTQNLTPMNEPCYPVSIAEPTAEPTVEPTVESTAVTPAQPTAEPTQEPIVEATAEPTAESTVEPTATPIDPADLKDGFNPDVLEFIWKAGDPNPEAKTSLAVGITSGYRYGASDSWIRYSEPSDAANGKEFSISVDPTGFTTPGVKEGTFTITQVPSNVVFTLRVVLNVESVPEPVFEPASLEFVWEKGRSNPASQQVIARNVGAVNAGPDKNWIRSSYGNYIPGGLEMNISVNPAIANLDVGIHEGQINLTTEGKTITLPIKLTVISRDGTLETNRQRLNFGGFLGDPIADQNVGLTYLGLGTSNWTASGPSWLTLTQTNGSVSATEPANLTVGVNNGAISQSGEYTSTLTVSDGTTTHEIAVTLFQVDPGSPTVQLFGLEVTQGIQNLLNDVPFVAKRPTFVRGHVRSLTGQPLDKVTARLIGTRDGTELGRLSPINSGGSLDIVADPDRAQLNESFLFELPESWRTGTVALRLEGQSQPIACVDPAEKSVENGAADDCSVTLTYEEIPVMPITYVLYKDKDYTRGPNNQEIGPVDFTATVAHADSTTRQLMAGLPLPGIDQKIYKTVINFGRVLGQNDKGKVLDQVAQLHDQEGKPRRHYYGLFARYPTTTDPNIRSFWGQGGVAQFPNDFAGMGGFDSRSPMSTLNMHEISHNLGRDHVACGLPAGEIGDTNFPDPDKQISTAQSGNETYYGFNIYTKKIYPPKHKSYMSYCSPEWISPYNYKAIMERLKTQYNPPAAQSKAVQQNTLAYDPIIAVTGRITGTVTGTIDNVAGDNASAAIPAATEESNYSLRLEDANGETLATYPVTPNVIDSHTRPRYLAYTVAIPETDNLDRIVLQHDEQPLAERRASDNAPTVTLSTPTGGELIDAQPLSITWNADDADGDTLDYNVDYSTDDGISWQKLAWNLSETTLEIDSADLPGSTQVRIRVGANDGFLTTFAVSEVFTVTEKLPIASIISTDLNSYYVGGQTIMLEGYGYDLEDGNLDDLTWHSDRNGVLGTGSLIYMNADDLAEGTHVIRLEAKDSQGQSNFDDLTVTAPGEEEINASNDSVSFDIFYDPPALPAEMAVTSALNFSTVQGTTELLTDTVEIKNLGDGDLSWTASSGAANVTLSSSSGDTPATVVVTVDPTGLADGLHEGTLTFTPTDETLSSATVDYYINVEIQEESAGCNLDGIPAPSNGEVMVRFVNNSDSAAMLYWRDLDDQLQEYATIQPGESRDQETFIGHVWEIYDANPLEVDEALTHLLLSYTASDELTQCVLVAAEDSESEVAPQPQEELEVEAEEAEEAATASQPSEESAVPQRIQAESGTYSGDATSSSQHEGFDGEGFAAFLTSAGTAIQIDANITSAGTYNMNIRYAAGPNGPETDRTMSLYVNGEIIEQVMFEQTGVWAEWADQETAVTLDEGMNSIEFRYDEGDTGFINIDYIELSRHD